MLRNIILSLLLLFVMSLPVSAQKKAANSKPTTIAALMEEAYSHVGARYRKGTAGPKAFDCSGFTSYVFKIVGIDLRRSSQEQYRQGSRVGKKELRRGDLVFFTSPSSGHKIGHVGIVVDANPSKGTFDFIHASSTGVRVTSSADAFYSRRYVGACRVI